MIRDGTARQRQGRRVRLRDEECPCGADGSRRWSHRTSPWVSVWGSICNTRGVATDATMPAARTPRPKKPRTAWMVAGPTRRVQLLPGKPQVPRPRPRGGPSDSAGPATATAAAGVQARFTVCGPGVGVVSLRARGRRWCRDPCTTPPESGRSLTPAGGSAGCGAEPRGVRLPCSAVMVWPAGRRGGGGWECRRPRRALRCDWRRSSRPG